MGERYLIINADDFGNSEGANKAIHTLFQEKRITSSTLMAPAVKADEALEIASTNNYSVGVHLTINSDFDLLRWHSVLPREQVPSLNDDQGLHHDPDLLAKSVKASELNKELDAQVQYMISKGCIPDHADNHCGTLYGMNGRLFFINAFKLCRRYNYPFRFPKGRGFLEEKFGEKIPAHILAAHKGIGGLAKIMGVPLLDEMFTNPFSTKEIGSYENLKAYYEEKIRGIGEGITEMFLHPCVPDMHMEKITDEWPKRVWEYEMLMDDTFFKIIEEEGIKLVSWGEAPFYKKREQRAV